MSSSNCFFLTCIQISQEADQVVWYSHLFQNFPQFIVIHTVKGFGIVDKAEIDVFLDINIALCKHFHNANISITKMHWLAQGLRKVLVEPGVMATQNFKRNPFLNLYREGEKI